MYFYKINEAAPEYQNLPQLLLRPAAVHLAKLVDLASGESTAASGAIMDKHPGVHGQHRDIQITPCSGSDAAELGP